MILLRAGIRGARRGQRERKELPDLRVRTGQVSRQVGDDTGHVMRRLSFYIQRLCEWNSRKVHVRVYLHPPIHGKLGQMQVLSRRMRVADRELFNVIVAVVRTIFGNSRA